MRRLAALVVALVVLAACSGDGGSGAGGDEGRKARSLTARVRTDPPGVIDVRDSECGFDGDRQFTASGVVENAGDRAHNVSIAVRFIDKDGVRVDLASDSVTALEPGEAARFDASIYNDDGGLITTCEISTTSS